MNYMEQVAKMLGVELGEKFRINFKDDHLNISGRDTSDHEYFFSNEGVEVITPGYACISSDVLFKLIRGEWEIKRKPWRPKNDDLYYLVEETGLVSCEVWCNDSIDINYYKLGNCYRTKKEAEANATKWKAFYESDEVVEV